MVFDIAVSVFSADSLLRIKTEKEAMFTRTVLLLFSVESDGHIVGHPLSNDM